MHIIYSSLKVIDNPTLINHDWHSSISSNDSCFSILFSFKSNFLVVIFYILIFIYIRNMYSSACNLPYFAIFLWLNCISLVTSNTHKRFENVFENVQEFRFTKVLAKLFFLLLTCRTFQNKFGVEFSSSNLFSSRSR